MQVQMQIFDMVPWILLGLAALACIGIVNLWGRLLRRDRSHELPGCGRCGYAAKGLESMICPECGADLREVGIVTPLQKKSLSPLTFAVVWTLCWVIVSVVIGGLLSNYTPMVTTGNASSSYRPVKSGEFQRVEIQASGRLPFQIVSVSVVGNSNQITKFHVDVLAKTYTATSPVQATPLAFDAAAALLLLGSVGADTNVQSVKDEADELVRIIDGWQHSGLHFPSTISPTGPYVHFHGMGGSSSFSGHPAAWFGITLLAVFLVVWVGGFVIFYRIRRKCRLV